MVDLPTGRLSGRALRALVTAVRRTPARRLITHVLRSQLGIDALSALRDELRQNLPTDFLPIQARERRERASRELGVPPRRDWPCTASAIARAYREQRASPEQVIERAFGAARAFSNLKPCLGPLYTYDELRARGAARDAAERIAQGRARSVLDGIPIAIKEEVDVSGLPTRLGTGWMPSAPASADSTAVARLRAHGAVILGHTPMTEYGMSPLGGNTHRVMPRNAHDPTRLPGGSSSGSAVAVALGVCPVALGADGGGSIRIPACFNGVFGIKPTFGRVPLTGHGLRGGSSVTHLGPIGASSEDLALFLEAAAGPHEHDRASAAQPPLLESELVHALGRGVSGLSIGIEESEWARAASDVTAPARQALVELERAGATLEPVRIELARHAAAIGYLTIALEMLAVLREVKKSHLDELGLDMQLLVSTVEAYRADDYLDAQRLRGELRREVAEVLRSVDVLALPTTAISAPPADDSPDGFVDAPALDGVCRFAFLGNLTGLPAGTAPIGSDAQGLPVGVQFLGDAWDEAVVLQLLAELERSGAAEVRRPAAAVNLLET